MMTLKWLRTCLVTALPVFGLGFLALGWWGYAALFFAVWIVYLRR